MQRFFTKELKKYCLNLGFDLFGVTLPRKSNFGEYFEKWLDKKYQADMSWLKKTETRNNPALVLKDCKSILLLGVSYFNRDYGDDEKNDNKRALIARYAWGDDYHLVLGEKMKQIQEWLNKQYSCNYLHKYYVDTGPILEKELATWAGLGFMGKNTQLINQNFGSYFFIACLFTQIPFEQSTTKVVGGCGTCDKCIKACPTKALEEPYVLNASKCLSYHTIENKGIIPDEIKKAKKNRIFGCDICQEVCPWNKRAKITKMFDLRTKLRRDKLTIEQIKEMDINEYRRIFKKSAVKRAKFSGLKRNIEGLN